MNILIIDDEPAVLTKMEAMLTPYGKCSQAASALQTMKLCADAVNGNVYFDLITIDIQLPDSNGIELLMSINQLEVKSNVAPAKKIMITSSSTKENLQKAFLNGCDGFMVKPVKRDTLDQKMQSLGFVERPGQD